MYMWETFSDPVFEISECEIAVVLLGLFELRNSSDQNVMTTSVLPFPAKDFGLYIKF